MASWSEKHAALRQSMVAFPAELASGEQKAARFANAEVGREHRFSNSPLHDEWCKMAYV
jgi:hypothetical protein